MHYIKNNLLALLIILSLSVSAQDVHFSQYFKSPMLLNPALTGMMNTDVRAAASYRTQWSSLATPFKTMSIAADFAPFRYAFNSDDIIGMGIYIMNDKAGSTQLSNTLFQSSFAYSKSLDGQGNNFLSLGAQIGYGQQRLDRSALTFDNQIEGLTINPSWDSGENIDLDQFGYWDFTAGVAWSYAPERSTSVYIGISAAHLNQPKVSFLSDDTELLYRKYIGYVGGEVRINYLLSLMGKGYFIAQGPFKEITTGAFAKFNFNDGRGKRDFSAMYLGPMVRWGDAVIFVAGYDFNNIGISFSYDINVSGISNVTRGYGAMEVSFVYKGNFETRGYGNRTIRSPEF